MIYYTDSNTDYIGVTDSTTNLKWCTLQCTYGRDTNSTCSSTRTIISHSNQIRYTKIIPDIKINNKPILRQKFNRIPILNFNKKLIVTYNRKFKPRFRESPNINPLELKTV